MKGSSQTSLKIKILEKPNESPEFKFIVDTPFSTQIQKSSNQNSTNFCWTNLESKTAFCLDVKNEPPQNNFKNLFSKYFNPSSFRSVKKPENNNFNFPRSNFLKL